MMYAAGMLRGTNSVYLLLLLVPLIGFSSAIPIQLLPSIPGYIPVYIRHGDQPLEEVNPDLAEAFHETQNIRMIANADDHLDHSTPKDDFDNKYLEKSKNRNSIYPLDGKKIQEDTAGNDKIENMYKLRANNKEENVEESNSKEGESKIGPITDEEKEKLLKLAAEVEKEETKHNDLFDANYRDLTVEVPHKNEEPVPAYPVLKFIPVSIIQDTSAEEPLVRRLPKEIANQSTTTTKDNNMPTPVSADENPPVKIQRPMGILSNVQKLSPKTLPEEKAPQASDV